MFTNFRYFRYKIIFAKGKPGENNELVLTNTLKLTFYLYLDNKIL